VTHGIAVILREGVRSTKAHPWRLLLGSLLIGGVLAASVIVDAAVTSGALHALDSEHAAGSTVLVVYDEGGPLPGRPCDALAAVPGVRAAGGVSTPETVSFASVGSMVVRRVFASPGYLRVLGVTLPISTGRSSASGIAGSAIAAEVGIADGSRLRFSDGLEMTIDVGPATARAPDRSRWVTIVQAAPAWAAECWIEAERGSMGAVRAAVPAVFADARALRIETLRDGAVTDAIVAGWKERPTRWAWIFGGALSAMLAGVFLAPRRREYALYRLLGVPDTRVRLIAAVEASILEGAAIVFGALVIGSAVVWSFGPQLNELAVTTATHLLLAVAALALATPVVAWLLASGDRADILRRGS
jgi:hypothetical protein